MLSVIVPVYNVERYLDRCIESILKQNYKDLELILVDDGSTDSSPAMCDAWVGRDGRVKVIHQRNVGLSGARNTGLEHACGEWITFVDSDDCLLPLCYESAMESLTVTGADVCMYGVSCESEDGGLHYCDRFEQNKIYTLDELMMQVVLPLKTAAWNKIFRKTLVAGITFPVGLIHGEDLVFFMRLLQPDTRIVGCSTIGYRYIKRSGSITTKKFSKHSIDEVTCKDMAQQLMKEKFSDYAAHSLHWCFMARLNMVRKLRGMRVSEYEGLYSSYMEWLADNYERSSHLLSFKHRLIYLFQCYRLPFFHRFR